MTYTKSQLEARVQTLSEVLEALDPVYFEHLARKPELAPRPRRALYNNLVAARKALAEAEEEAVSKANEFDLLLADEKRKAYDQGRADGYEKGYEVGWCLGSSRP